VAFADMRIYSVERKAFMGGRVEIEGMDPQKHTSRTERVQTNATGISTLSIVPIVSRTLDPATSFGTE
jgi:hypothetical protein